MIGRGAGLQAGLTCAVAFAVAAAAQAPVAPPGAASPPAPGEIVRIDLIATDNRGQPIETLTARDFELREDGFVQAIESARHVKVNPGASAGGPATSPITSAADERAEAARENTRVVAIYLDEYFVSRDNAPRVRTALHRFVDEDLGPRDLVTIMRPLDSLLKIRLTRDRVALHQAINAFEGRRGDYEPRTAFERSYIVGDRGRADSQRVQTTWSSLNALALHLANLGAGRTSLLLVSEQADPATRRRGFESLPSSSSVMRTANRSSVSIYVLDPRDEAERSASSDEGPNLLTVLADDTDGALLTNPAESGAGLKRMMADATSYYLLTYLSQRNRDGLFHAVDVTVKKPGVHVRARKGYWAPTPDEVQRANWMAHANDPRPVAPLEPPLRSSPLIRPWFGMSRGANGQTRVTFVWEPSGVVPGDRRVKIASRVAFKALNADDSTLFEGTIAPSGPIQISGDRTGAARAVFDAPPGRLRLRMSVEDSASQPIDTDVRNIIVRDLRGGVVLGTPEVFRARTARDLRELQSDETAVPVAAREFSRAENLLIRFMAYAPEGVKPSISAKLVSKAGAVMRELAVVSPTTSGGANQMTVPLAGLPSGDYTVQIVAAAPPADAKDTVAIRITN